LSLARASSFWREQESSGILRNPEESGVNTGIPEFLRKIPVKSEKNRNSCDLSKTTFLWKIPQENTGKKTPQESCRERFLGPKNKFLKRGITNLAPNRYGDPQTKMGCPCIDSKMMMATARRATTTMAMA